MSKIGIRQWSARTSDAAQVAAAFGASFGGEVVIGDDIGDGEAPIGVWGAKT